MGSGELVSQGCAEGSLGLRSSVSGEAEETVSGEELPSEEGGGGSMGKRGCSCSGLRC